jgi:dephospho-CoA kinase
MFIQIFKLRVMQMKQLVVLDAPLLFETKFLEYVTGPILVVFTADKVKQRQRLMDRNKISAKEA